jgi:hypothetical protein
VRTAAAGFEKSWQDSSIQHGVVQKPAAVLMWLEKTTITIQIVYWAFP